MAPAPTAFQEAAPVLPTSPGNKGSRSLSFDASKHLHFEPPSRVWSLQDLGYPDSQGISPIGVTEPFRLFSEEAIGEMRRELFTSKQIWSSHRFSSKYAECQLRGYARE
jgi:hypothetical protein